MLQANVMQRSTAKSRKSTYDINKLPNQNLTKSAFNVFNTAFPQITILNVLNPATIKFLSHITTEQFALACFVLLHKHSIRLAEHRVPVQLN